MLGVELDPPPVFAAKRDSTVAAYAPPNVSPNVSPNDF